MKKDISAIQMHTIVMTLEHMMMRKKHIILAVGKKMIFTDWIMIKMERHVKACLDLLF